MLCFNFVCDIAVGLQLLLVIQLLSYTDTGSLASSDA